MKKEELFKNLEFLGLSLLRPASHEFDAHKVLAEVAKSDNVRLWEAFPLVLANSFRKGLVRLNELDKQLKNTSQRRRLRSLVTISCVLYEYLKLKFEWSRDLKKSSLYDQRLFNNLLQRFRKNQNLEGDLKKVSSERVVHTFKTYFGVTKDTDTYTQMREDFALEYALSQLFSKKQKELFMRKLKREKLTKTEREYYSRTVKKKVLALANEKLHRLALELSKE